MSDSSSNTQNSLEETWNNVWDFWSPDNSWKNDQDKCIEIQKKLVSFDTEHYDDLDHIDGVIKAVSRGVALIQAATGWQEPAIGKNKSRKPLDKLRGYQWRLVITYSGFEITVKALMNQRRRGTDLEAIKKFVRKCHLPEYIPLVAPDKTSSLEKWLNKEEGELAQFLGVTSGDQKILENWLVKSQPIDSWEKAVKLAKAIRNASAHGFLVANKVKEWGLKPGLCKLTNDLALIVEFGLHKLT
jgi:hypothetical protein